MPDFVPIPCIEALFKLASSPRSVGFAVHLRIPMMSISHSDVMPIRSERSDARLS